MAQRFPVPNTGNNGPPPQRYPPPSVPPNLRQYPGPNFPVRFFLNILLLFYSLLLFTFLGERLNCGCFFL